MPSCGDWSALIVIVSDSENLEFCSGFVCTDVIWLFGFLRSTVSMFSEQADPANAIKKMIKYILGISVRVFMAASVTI
jgi:hypothetical protein